MSWPWSTISPLATPSQSPRTHASPFETALGKFYEAHQGDLQAHLAALSQAHEESVQALRAKLVAQKAEIGSLRKQIVQFEGGRHPPSARVTSTAISGGPRADHSGAVSSPGDAFPPMLALAAEPVAPDVMAGSWKQDFDRVPSDRVHVHDIHKAEDPNLMMKQQTEDTDHNIFNPDDPSALESWKRIVAHMLYKATKDFFELRSQWVQSEQFVQRQIRSYEDVDLLRSLLNGTRPDGGVVGPRVQSYLKNTSSTAHALRGPSKLDIWDTWSQKIVLDPQSPKKLLWAVVGMVLMLYDLVMLPMQAFEVEQNDFMVVISWFTQIFWTIDIALSFITGIYVNSELERRLSRIIPSYLKTWFVIDIIVTMPIWILLFTGLDNQQASATQSLKTAKYVRMLRFLRLARLAKVDHLLSETLEFINSSTVLLSIHIMKLIFCLLLVNHVNACLWFAMGQIEESGGRYGWAMVQTIEERGLWYKYFTASHWAVTQFQGTSNINVGETFAERFYAVVAVFFALVTLCSFVSKLTNMMIQLQSLHAHRTYQQRVVRGYLSNHQISSSLSVRVKKYVTWKQRLEEKQEHETEVLNIVPGRLLAELLEEAVGPSLRAHIFFKTFCKAHGRTFRKVCCEATTTMFPAPGEHIFNVGESCENMYFVQTGVLSYTVTTFPEKRTVNPLMALGSIPVDVPRVQPKDFIPFKLQQDMAKGEYLCEAVLWTPSWEHVGEFVNSHSSTLLVINSDAFAKVILSHPPSHASSILYARRFVAGLNAFGKTYTDYIRAEQLMEMLHDDDDIAR